MRFSNLNVLKMDFLMQDWVFRLGRSVMYIFTAHKNRIPYTKEYCKCC